jgi:protocatechuate 3,4-dioxygenase beta subunit
MPLSEALSGQPSEVLPEGMPHPQETPMARQLPGRWYAPAMTFSIAVATRPFSGNHVPSPVLTSLILLSVACTAEEAPPDELDRELPETVTVRGEQPEVPNWSGMHDAPDSLSWSTRIAQSTEPGERLVVTGTVYGEDRTTPERDVRIYVYHTNAEGVYPKRGDERGTGRYHGYLRGWMKTDAEGRYQFETIRPAPYETHGGEPAHVHYTIQAPGEAEYWLNAAWFSDDPRVTAERLATLQRTGGFSNVMEVSRDASGVWHARRDIVLESHG